MSGSDTAGTSTHSSGAPPPYLTKVAAALNTDKPVAPFGVVTLVVLLVAADAVALGGSVRHWWSDLVDPLIGIATLAFASSIWIRGRVSKWEDSLPKVLNVTFVAAGLVDFRVEAKNLPLSGPSDIRALAQQFGKSWNSHFELPLGLNYTITSCGAVTIPNSTDVVPPTAGSNKRRARKAVWVQMWECRYPLEIGPSDGEPADQLDIKYPLTTGGGRQPRRPRVDLAPRTYSTVVHPFTDLCPKIDRPDWRDES